MIVLVTAGRIEPWVSAIVLLPLLPLSTIALFVTGWINNRRELDEIVRRVEKEEADARGATGI